ncbi:MAG: STAS domain-containing protein [Kineosporiaceae bacterium]|nr:STAS domain-containing protein [Aeromicrobium sp.]
MNADRLLVDPHDNCEIEVSGDINVSTAPALRDQLLNAIDGGYRYLKIDVQRAEFLDASGLGVLVGASQRTRANGGSLELIGANKRLIQILAITGLDKDFGVATSARTRGNAQSLVEITEDQKKNPAESGSPAMS